MNGANVVDLVSRLSFERSDEVSEIDVSSARTLRALQIRDETPLRRDDEREIGPSSDVRLSHKVESVKEQRKYGGVL